MSDASDDAVRERDPESGGDTGESADEEIEALRQEVEQKYDFEDFGPQEMAEMSQEEWEAAFDPDTWITGEELLDRVEADLKNRVVTRDVFARVERFDDLIIAYSDSGYAAVYADGTVEGSGTVLRDVKPTVALCSMDSYDVPEMPEGDVLPQPQDVPESSDALGNTVLQVVAAVQLLAGAVLLGAGVLYLTNILSPPGASSGTFNLWLLFVAGIGFALIGVFLFVMVANARLSDKFRAEEFRNRLRAVGLEDDERPDFLDELDGDLPERLRAADEETADADAGATSRDPDDSSDSPST
ncbi:DUF308 domain-containing protein [Salinibaculum rarum]|uniref:DUF308 domain-containing protein n=1 Tax=Salinibaculum rarum TaxID=3058903 RepID=UPI00265FEF0F|nr:DUF308 domain-containing protein [Salinibaculum sp. KK48]